MMLMPGLTLLLLSALVTFTYGLWRAWALGTFDRRLDVQPKRHRLLLALARRLEARASRRDPTPGEMQYLLRIAELWCYEHPNYAKELEVRPSIWLWTEPEAVYRLYDKHFWKYIQQGEAARVGPELGFVHGISNDQLETGDSLYDHNNVPRNWQKIVDELRSESLCSRLRDRLENWQ